MAKAEASVEELVGMIERGELRLPEMQRRYVWRSTRVRDLLDSLYRGYPSGAILLWETDEAVPLQDFAVTQQANPYQSTRLLLDGQQRLTSLSCFNRRPARDMSGRQALILMEAKAHTAELSVAGKLHPIRQTSEQQHRSDANHSQIARAIAEANAALRCAIPGVALDRDRGYQFANRIAFAWKLASLGVPVAL